MDVTAEAKIHPAGRRRPSLTLYCLGKKLFEEGGLRPGGKVLPSHRMDRVASGPDSTNTGHPNQAVPNDLPCGNRDDLPIHNALASTTLGTALDGEKSDPKEIVRKFHAN